MKAEKFPKPSRNAFEKMAKKDPKRLMRWIDELDSVAKICDALEYLGKYCDNTKLVVPFILDWLNHEAPMVREGAVEGLAHHSVNEVVACLEDVAENDKSKGVRTAASDCLEGIELNLELRNEKK